MVTIRKIDFFGGVHGNYLELVVNHWIDQNVSYDITLPQFNSNGACHLKNDNADYCPITTAQHYSYFGMQFNDTDLVIRIVPTQDDLLIAITNSFLRAGDQTLDLENLENNTYEKMSSLPKMAQFVNTLVTNHGLHDRYSRKVLRKYFYSMFDDYEYGLSMFVDWTPVKNFYNFDFRRFFNFSSFIQGLQEISKFVNLEFSPTPQLIDLHKNFLQLNQGYHSELKCNKVVEAILHQQSMDLKLNIVEEAWVNYKISKMFNLYDVVELEQDVYPATTDIISKICFTRK